jgi:prepilin signal peptidase PulO-like enzyme (type II secretory pathway)
MFYFKVVLILPQHKPKLRRYFMKNFLIMMGIMVGVLVTLASAILLQIYANAIFGIIIGTGLVATSFWAYKYLSYRETMELAKLDEQRLKTLIDMGTRVTVDLSKCKMRSSSYHVEKKGLDYLNEMEAIEIIFDTEENAKPEAVIQTVLIYAHRLSSGKIIKFNGPTSKDKRTLEMLCAIQKHTTIYFDPNDPKVYYFDLAFLE